MTPLPTSSRERDRAWRAAIWVVLVSALLRALMALWVPPFPDETYYWEWSRHLDFGYFDHPPGIAFLIAAGTTLLGPSVAGIRLGVLLTGGLATFAVVALTRRIGGEAAALRAAVVLACIPFAAAGLLLATPDAPLLFATALTFLAVDRALVSEPGSLTDTRWWILAGVGAGFGFVSKLTAVLVPFGITVAFFVRPDLRRRLRTPGPWLSAAVALLLFAPVVVWNARNEWISFAFQLGHGLGSGGGSLLLRELELVGGQAGLVSPILFVLMGVAIARAARDPNPRRALLAISALVMGGFFVVSALRKPVEANWPAAAYVPATVVLATAVWRRNGGTWLRWGAGLGGVLVLAVYVQALVPWMPLRPDDDPIARAHGWSELARGLQDHRERLEAEGCPRVWYGSRTYQAASETSFHLPGNPFAISTNLQSRPNQYDLWPGFPTLAAAGDCLILYGTEPGTREAAAELEPYFAQSRQVAAVPRTRAGREIDRYNVWLLTGWSGETSPFR